MIQNESFIVLLKNQTYKTFESRNDLATFVLKTSKDDISSIHKSSPVGFKKIETVVLEVRP